MGSRTGRAVAVLAAFTTTALLPCQASSMIVAVKATGDATLRVVVAVPPGFNGAIRVRITHGSVTSVRSVRRSFTTADLAPGGYRVRALAGKGTVAGIAGSLAGFATSAVLKAGRSTSVRLKLDFAPSRVSSSASGTLAAHNTSSFDPDVVWSPDGTRVVFASTATNLVRHGSPLQQLYVKNVRTGAIQLVSSASDGTPADGGATSPTWSPDGTQIMFQSSSTDLVGGAGAADGSRFDTFVKTLVNGKISLVDSTTTGAPGDAGSTGGTWSPDGKRILFSSEATDIAGATGAPAGSFGFVKTLATGAVLALGGTVTGLPAGVTIDAPWSPDSRHVLFASTDPVPDGDANLNEADEIDAEDVTTGTVTVITSLSHNTAAVGYGDAPTWSPDGSRVAFHFVGDPGALAQGVTDGVFVKDTTTSTVALVSTNAQGDTATRLPIWSPDGTRILFSMSTASGASHWYVDTLATATLERVGSGDDFINNGAGLTAWSPDGRRIAYETTLEQAGQRGQVWIEDMQTGARRNLSIDKAFSSTHLDGWSPDGRRLLVTLVRPPSSFIPASTAPYVLDARTGKPTSIHGTGNPRQLDVGRSGWRPNGTALAFGDDRGLYLMLFGR
jgi:Tol biopolymer transport system component